MTTGPGKLLVELSNLKLYVSFHKQTRGEGEIIVGQSSPCQASEQNCCEKDIAKLAVQSVGSGGIAELAAESFPYFEETFLTTKGWFA